MTDAHNIAQCEDIANEIQELKIELDSMNERYCELPLFEDDFDPVKTIDLESIRTEMADLDPLSDEYHNLKLKHNHAIGVNHRIGEYLRKKSFEDAIIKAEARIRTLLNQHRQLRGK